MGTEDRRMKAANTTAARAIWRKDDDRIAMFNVSLGGRPLKLTSCYWNASHALIREWMEVSAFSSPVFTTYVTHVRKVKTGIVE